MRKRIVFCLILIGLIGFAANEMSHSENRDKVIKIQNSQLFLDTLPKKELSKARASSTFPCDECFLKCPNDCDYVTSNTCRCDAPEPCTGSCGDDPCRVWDSNLCQCDYLGRNYGCGCGVLLQSNGCCPGEIMKECGCDTPKPSGDCDCNGNEMEACGCGEPLQSNGCCPGEIMMECGCDTPKPSGDCDCNGNEMEACGCGEPLQSNGCCPGEVMMECGCDTPKPSGDCDCNGNEMEACGCGEPLQSNGCCPGEVMMECGCDTPKPSGDCDCNGNEMEACGCGEPLQSNGCCPGEIMMECGCDTPKPSGDCDCNGNEMEVCGCGEPLQSNGCCPGEIMMECGCDTPKPSGDCDCNGNEMEVCGCGEPLQSNGCCPGEIMMECGCDTPKPSGDCDCNGNEMEVCGCGEPLQSNGCCPGEIMKECGCDTPKPSGDCDCNGNEMEACGCGEPLQSNGCCPGEVMKECGCDTPKPSGDCDCNGNEMEACGCGVLLQSNGCCPGEIMMECGCDTPKPSGDCDCYGNKLDECGICGGSGIPLGECGCDGAVPGDPCDDNDPCTENDVLQLLCECKGTPIVNPALTNPGQKICLDAQPFEISVNPSGGEFSGEGITEGLFDPSINGIGTYTITYNLTTSSGCDQSLSFPIKVVNCDTTQTCDGVQIGESCNDNDSLTINDLIKVNCLCQGTSLVDEPDDLVGLPDTICFSDLPYTTEPALLGGDHNLQPQTLNQDNYVAGETYIIRSFYSDQANGIWIEDYDTITITGHNFDLSRDLLGLPNIIESCDGTFNQSVFPTEGSNMQYEVTLNGNIVQTGEGENGLNIENNGFGTYEINGTIDGCSVTKSFTVVEGNCPTCTLGSPCSEDPCMIGGRFDKDCNCVGGVELEEDDDGDGVPNCEDICPGFDDKKDDNGDGKPDDCYDCLTESTVGQPCDDGDICTVNDKYDQNCQCKGEKQRIYVDIIPNDLTLCVGESYRAPGVDTVWNDLWEFDKDGWLKPRITRRVQQRYVCLYTYNEDGCKVEEHQFINIIDCPCEDEEDISKGCDDGDPCTILDKYNKNCECEGILDPRDSDGDGVVDECDVCNNYDDTKDLNENGVPDDCEECDNEIGTPCDDNDPCTYYDEYINPCTCSGIFKLPEDSIILAPKAICLEEGGIQLNAIYPDGNWIGSHIDTNGLFTPTDSGRYVICYEFEATDCSTIKRSFCTDIEVKGHRLVTINTPYDTVCSDALSFSILASISNGVFSGSGMETLSGLFNPNEAESGWNTITYTLESDECTQISEIQIFVDPCMIGGCTDTLAQNYNAEATVSDTCIYCADFTFDTIGLYVLCSGETQTIMAPTSRATSTISWVNQSNNEVVSNSSSLEWTAPLDTDYGQSDHFTVTATDQFGCSIGQTVTLVYIPTPTVSQSVNNGNCTSESSIVFTLNRDYGNEELEISLDGGSTYEMIEEQDSGTYIMPMYTSGTYTPIVRWKDDETTNRCFEVTMESITIDSISSSCDDPDCHSPQNVSALPFLDVFDCQIGHIIMSATGENLEYSLDGQLFQTSNSFTNLNRGIYDVTIRNGVTKCETTVKVILDGECPSNCDATEILVEVSHIDTCENETTGCIEMSVNAEGYEYSMDGINFSSNGLFCDLHQGAYALIARKIDGTCTITSEGSINFTGECHDCSSITPLSIEGDSIGCINDSFTLMVNGEYDEGTLLWSLPAGQTGTGATTRTITVSESGTYSVSATLNGCELSSSFKVVQSPFECDSTCIPNAITIISSPNGFGYGSSSHIENTRITENGLVIRPQMNNGSAELALQFSSTPSDFSFGVTIGGHSYGLNIDNIASFIHPNVTEGCNPISPEGAPSIGQGDILRIRVKGSVVSIWLNGDMLYAEDIGSAGTLEHFFITEGDNPFLEATIGLDEEGCPDGLEDRPISELPPPIEPCEEDECNIPLSIQIVAQDTCNGILGSIIVSSDSVGVSYSLDGISYSESGSFDNLQAGTYTLHSQKDTCNSSTEVVIEQSDSCLTCSDGIQNGDETNIDCGGTMCPECLIGCTDSLSFNYNPLANVQSADSCTYCDDFTLFVEFANDTVCPNGIIPVDIALSPPHNDFRINFHFLKDVRDPDGLLLPGEHMIRAVATNFDGCSVVGFGSFYVKSAPDVSIQGPLSACEGESITLSLIGALEADADIEWSDGTNGTSFDGVAGEDYSVSISQNGCSVTQQFKSELMVCDSCDLEVTLDIDNSFCSDSEISISALTNSNEELTYLWDNGNTSSTLNFSASPGTHFVSLTVTDESGCSVSISDTIEVIDVESISIVGSERICENDSILLSVGGSFDPSAEILWSNGSTASAIYGHPNMTYTVSVIRNGCTSTSSIETMGVPCDSLCRIQNLNFEISDGRVRIAEGSNVDIGHASSGEIILASPGTSNFEYRMTLDNEAFANAGIDLTLNSGMGSFSLFNADIAMMPLDCYEPPSNTIPGILYIRVVDGVLSVWTSEAVFLVQNIGDLNGSSLSMTGDFSSDLSGSLVSNGDGCPDPIDVNMPMDDCSPSDTTSIGCQILAHDNGSGSGEILVTINSEDTIEVIYINGDPVSPSSPNYHIFRNLSCGVYDITVDTMTISCETEILATNTSETIYIGSGDCVTIDYSNNCFEISGQNYCIAWEPNDDSVSDPFSSITEICPPSDTCYTMNVIDDDGNISQTKEVCFVIDTVCNLSAELIPFNDCNTIVPYIAIDIQGGEGPYDIYLNDVFASSTSSGTGYTFGYYGNNSISITDATGCSVYSSVNIEKEGFEVVISDVSWGNGNGDFRSALISVRDSEGKISVDGAPYTIIVEYRSLIDPSRVEIFNGTTESGFLRLTDLVHSGIYSVKVTDSNGCMASNSFYQGNCSNGYPNNPGSKSDDVDIEIVHIDLSQGIYGSLSTNYLVYGTIVWVNAQNQSFNGASVENINTPGLWQLRKDDHTNCIVYEKTVEILCTTTFSFNERISIDNGGSCVQSDDETITISLENIYGINDVDNVEWFINGVKLGQEGTTLSGVPYGQYTAVIIDEIGCKMIYPINVTNEVRGVSISNTSDACLGIPNGSVSLKLSNPNGDAAYLYLDETNGIYLGRDEEIVYTIDDLEADLNYTFQFQIGDCTIDKEISVGTREFEEVFSHEDGITCVYDLYCDGVLYQAEGSRINNRNCDTEHVSSGGVGGIFRHIASWAWQTAGICCTNCESCESPNGQVSRKCTNTVGLRGDEYAALINTAIETGYLSQEYGDDLKARHGTSNCRIFAVCPINFSVHSRAVTFCEGGWEPCEFLGRFGLPLDHINCETVCRPVTEDLIDYIHNHENYLSSKAGYNGSALADLVYNEYVKDERYKQYEAHPNLPSIECAKVSFCPDDFSSASVQMRDYFCDPYCVSNNNCGGIVPVGSKDTESNCGDGEDNDGDGLIDCQDLDCFETKYVQNLKQDILKRDDEVICPILTEDEECRINASLDFYRKVLKVSSTEEAIELNDKTQWLENNDPVFACYEDDAQYDFYGYGGLLYCEAGLWVYMRETEPGYYDYWRFEYPIDGGCQRWAQHSAPLVPEQMNFLIAMLDAFEEIGHATLDVGGLIPVAGAMFDATNGLWYTIEGDYVKAGFSFGAIFLESLTSHRILKYYRIGANRVSIAWKLSPDGTRIFFGSRGQLKRLMALHNIPLFGRHAHHMIPWGLQGDALIQLAAKNFNDPFHINDISNGYGVLLSIHKRGHRAYNTLVRNTLRDLTGILGMAGKLNEANAAKVLKALQEVLSREMGRLENAYKNGQDVSMADVQININEILMIAGI